MTLHPDFRAVQPWTTVDGYLDLLRVIEQQGCDRKCRAHSAWYSFAHPGRLANAGIGGGASPVGPSIRSRWPTPGKTPTRAWTVSAKPCRRSPLRRSGKRIAPGYIRTHLEGSTHRSRIARSQINPPPRSQAGVPFLSEPWYCCAEPTRTVVSIGGPEAAGEKCRRKRRWLCLIPARKRGSLAFVGPAFRGGPLFVNNLDYNDRPVNRLLLFTAKLGYQTRSFEDAARKLGVQLVYVTDRCTNWKTRGAIKPSPCISKRRTWPPTPSWKRFAARECQRDSRPR